MRNSQAPKTRSSYSCIKCNPTRLWSRQIQTTKSTTCGCELNDSHDVNVTTIGAAQSGFQFISDSILRRAVDTNRKKFKKIYLYDKTDIYRERERDIAMYKWKKFDNIYRNNCAKTVCDIIFEKITDNHRSFNIFFLSQHIGSFREISARTSRHATSLVEAIKIFA